MKTLLLILVLSFAASAQTAKERASAEGKAIVYIYAPSAVTTLVQIKKPVFVDDKEIADIRPERYFIVALAPGTHTFRMKNKKKVGGIEMNFEAGKTYYIRVNWSTGNIVFPIGLTKIEPESGAYDVKQLEPVKPENIKEKSFVFTEVSKQNK